ncbi:MAG: NUDIX domain-containing protein [Actinomycetota bacterium]
MILAVNRRLRRTAKVLLVDEHQRVLLFRGIDRTRPETGPWWFAVGGEIEPGEDSVSAAVRELFEETGLRIVDPGPVVLTRRFAWDFEGSAYDQEETYFLVRTDEFEPVAEAWSETERATMTGHRWWSVDDLRTTKEKVYPEGLADLLPDLLEP